MNVVFRVDASKKVGNGHFYRCLNLAETLENNPLLKTEKCLQLMKKIIQHAKKSTPYKSLSNYLISHTFVNKRYMYEYQ